MVTTASDRAWKTGFQIGIMRREAADGGPDLRVPVVLQYRTSSRGNRYRWKEQYDYGAGDASAEFESEDKCIADGRRHIDAE